jgi:hypothetical protein
MARDLDRLMPDIMSAIASGMAEGLKQGNEVAKGKSSGPFSLNQLARMDHPYATRHPQATLDPSTINVQSGAFLAAWQTGTVRVSKFDVSGSIVNANPVADYLQFGTRRMVARPIVQAITPEITRLVEVNIESAVTRQLNAHYA